ncbi:MAG: DegT/DnrJ/EryC1/StrS family aminotransferase [Chloroflexi bacterium]|nr:DegT/DnrJ/EryC1/StrS family aminotransferase [Chloroflexota bacterium]
MWKIPLFDITFDEQELEATQRVIRSGWLTMGEMTQTFERQFAEFVGVKHAIAVSNCTTALHLANLALGIGPDDEVICPALTFVAAANSILYTGARPVFADIKSLNDFTISPEDIEAKITQKTKAIQVMHYAGYPCDMDPIMDLAKAHRLHVVEDCAHAPGAIYKGRQCGNLGHIGCFSFFSNKNMTTGEGGMVTTNDDELAAKIKLMRSHGMTSLTLDRHKGHAHTYDVVELGFNYRIDEIRAAIGLSQLAKLEKNNEQRKKIVESYQERLAEIPAVESPFKGFEHKPAYHILPILLDKRINRSMLIEEMKLKGIQTSIHYPSTHLFSYYKNRFEYRQGELSLTEEVSDRELTLPLYPHMNLDQIEFVCSTLREITEKLS